MPLPGEIWLAEIPFTDGSASKIRPVLVLWLDVGDAVVAAVTSAAPRSTSDVSLQDWQAEGLRAIELPLEGFSELVAWIDCKHKIQNNRDHSAFLNNYVPTLYGTASHGGYVTNISSVSANGTVFAVNTNGTNFVVLKYIPGSQPYPYAGLVLSSNTLYGTTYGSGSSFGMAFAVNTNGTSFTNLNSFGGKRPQANLSLGSNTLYGTTFGGGGTDYGSVFAINTDGTGFTNLIAFNYQSATNGGQPEADLVLSGNTLYGTTIGGSGGGTVFKINTDGTDFAILKSLHQ
jgi:uncharacterized repeat protein (TIGR03803 family)